MVAVGLSGLVAAGLGAAGGSRFVSGDPPNVTYTRARCAEFLEYEPHAGTCEEAATAHHFTEVVGYRIAAGLGGGAVLIALVLVRRRRPKLFTADRLPLAFDDTIATTLFGVAAAGLLGFGVDQMVLGYNGSGFYLSGGIVAALFALWFAARFLQQVGRGADAEPRIALAS